MAEVKHRDFCVEEFDENEKQTLVKNNEIKDLEGLIAKSEVHCCGDVFSCAFGLAETLTLVFQRHSKTNVT